MKKEDLIKLIEKIPDNADLVIGECFVIDEKEAITAILDVPIVGLAYSQEDNELRFVLKLDDVKKCFHPKNVKFFEKDKDEAKQE